MKIESVVFNAVLDELNSVEFVKRKYDMFSTIGVFGWVATVYYLTFDTIQFLENMENWFMLLSWVVMIVYPIVRYFLSFHIYKLTNEGILLKSGFIKWVDIKTVNVYDNYEEEKGEDVPKYRLEITLELKDAKKETISFSNYTIRDEQLLKNVKSGLIEGKKIKDVLVVIFMKFYDKRI